jgi:hypothetical protein
MENANEHGSAKAARKPKSFSDDNLVAPNITQTQARLSESATSLAFEALRHLQGNGKDDSKVTEADGPDNELPHTE